MINNRYIKRFEEKQDLKFIDMVDDRIAYFGSTYYFDIQDIKWDIDNNIAPGKIILYLTEGMESGSMPPYKEWLTNNFGL